MPGRPRLSLPAGWRAIDAQSGESVVFSLPGVRVRGHTVVAEDADLRERVRAALGATLDGPVRFAFATTLSFEPPLRPSSALSLVFPTIRGAAEREFEADLRERGFAGIDRQPRERTRRPDGTRISIRPYDATVTLGPDEYACEARLGVWHAEGTAALAGGAYLVEPVDDVAVDPARFRQELHEIVRTVDLDD